MPRLNERTKPLRRPTLVNLPQETRDQLEAAIGSPGINSLTDAVIEGAKLLPASVAKKQRPKKKT